MFVPDHDAAPKEPEEPQFLQPHDVVIPRPSGKDCMYIGERRSIKLDDGSSISMWKSWQADEVLWQHQVEFYKKNPETAKRMENLYRDSEAIKQLMMQREVQTFYQSSTRHGDQAVTSRLVALSENPELSHIFADIRHTGNKAMEAHTSNQPMMAKLSKAMGGLPEDLRETLKQIQETPVNLQDACKEGRISLIREHLRRSENRLEEINGFDARGISCLAYAIGANRVGVVKFLMDKKADYRKVDRHGSTAVHYAAAYGRGELLEFFIQAGGDFRAPNAQGLSPMDLARRNKQQESLAIMRMYGADVD